MDCSFVLDLLILFVILANVLFCPYTKVEESFNLQATHDILYYGFNISKYDHVQYPGVVPRTFIGPLVLAIISSPFVAVLNLANVSKIYSQYVVRMILGLCSSLSFSLFRNGVAQSFGKSTANCLAVITLSQFHLLFYMSRTLPNIFALIFVLSAFYFWLSGRHSVFTWLSAFAIIIFRAELAMLMGPIILLELYQRKVLFIKAFLHAAAAGITSVGLTILIDSYFWQRLSWPEAEVFWFNTVLNKSSNWGVSLSPYTPSVLAVFFLIPAIIDKSNNFLHSIQTSPFLWYFYSALPRALSVFTPFIIAYGLKMDKRTKFMFAISIMFVLLFSFLPHKELRFIFYIVPLLNVVAAVGLNSVYQNIWKWNFEIRQFVSIITLGGLFANIVLSSIHLYIARSNYPGGVAFTAFHEHLQDSKDNRFSSISVHICNLAAQTGVSRFGEVQQDMSYSKEEYIDGNLEELKKFSYLIVEGACESSNHPSFKILQEISAFDGLSLQKSSQFPYLSFIKYRPKLCILKTGAY